MNETYIAAITHAKGRKYLYHFTRASNLRAIAHFDSLMSSSQLKPELVGERRLEAEKVSFRDYPATINPTLRIAQGMFDPAITQQQFRTYLDQHVFFWPTLKDCLKMLVTYTRREPDESFAVLVFDAFSLLTEHYPAVKLSKYDSGSSPRFPQNCSYKKSLEMFLPLDRFTITLNSLVPTKASEIKEVLVEDKVSHVFKHLQAVYVDGNYALSDQWIGLFKPLVELHA